MRKFYVEPSEKSNDMIVVSNLTEEERERLQQGLGTLY